MSRYYRSVLEESGASYTSRTTAFATATGITDTTILNALNTFDLGLISNVLDTKMKALYPFVGGTATTHKYNFMDARDLDVAFRLQFNGGGTHSSNGYQPNGTNAYANTFLKPSVNSSLNSGHISYYSRTTSNGTEVEIGTNGTNADYQLLEIRTSGTSYFAINSNVGSVADSDSKGLYLANRTSSTLLNGWKNNLKVVSGLNSSTSLSPYNIYIGAISNYGTAVLYSTKECAFLSIGSGLTDTEASTFYNLVQAMQTTLSRQV